jgi:hypothetical protein
LSTPEKEDETYITDTKSTIIHMLEHFVPGDRQGSDNELHRKIRKGIQEPIDATEDNAFTRDEIIVNLKKIQLEKGSWRGWFN